MSPALTSCGHFGYTDQVLWRIPSPDGRLVAVCQEVPAFDGPGYEVRLEDREGQLVRKLYEAGEAQRCDEATRSPDGHLAVVTRHIGRVRIVDTAFALVHPDMRGTSHYLQVANFSDEGNLGQAWNPRFTTSGELKIRVCTYVWEEYRQTFEFRCSLPEETRTVALGTPPHVLSRHD